MRDTSGRTKMWRAGVLSLVWLGLRMQERSLTSTAVMSDEARYPRSAELRLPRWSSQESRRSHALRRCMLGTIDKTAGKAIAARSSPGKAARHYASISAGASPR